MQISCAITHFTNFEDISSLAEAAREEIGKKTLEDIARGNTMTRSGLVLLCGYFEGFLREMCKEFIEILNDSKVEINRIPVNLISEHVGDCINNFKRKKTKGFFQVLDSFVSDTAISLDSSKLSQTLGNPTVDVIEGLFASFGVPDVLDYLSIRDFPIDTTFGSDSQLTPDFLSKLKRVTKNDVDIYNDVIKAIEGKWMPKAKRRRFGYLAVIDELLRRRNKIAHGEGIETITPDELLNVLSDIRKLCIGLIDVLEERLFILLTPTLSNNPKKRLVTYSYVSRK